ncbi:MAG: ABC transporter ATP-binding protein, partial [bacterium]
ISQGMFFGFVGPNGAGKSTTINAMVGLIKPSDGTIKIAGYDVSKEPLSVKARVGFMAEETILYERLTGREYLEFVGMMYGMDKKNAIERRESLLGLLDLDGNKFMGSFSLGMKKKIALASALIHNPPSIILDEPFSGIDATTGSRIRKVLGEMVSKGHTVFFSSHVLETVERVSREIGVIDKGRLLAVGSLMEIKEKAGCDPNASLEEAFLSLVEGKPGE